MPSSAMALVFWLKEKKTSIVKIEDVREEDRKPGCVSQVLWSDGVRYPAQIVKIAKCQKTLEMADSKFVEALSQCEKVAEHQTSVPKRRVIPSTQKGRAAAAATVASENTVARALGEKPSLDRRQQEIKKANLQQQKQVRDKERITEKESDLEAMKAPSLFSLPARETVKHKLNFDAEDDMGISKVSKVASAPDVPKSCTGNEPSPQTCTPNTEEMGRPLQVLEVGSGQNGCQHCKLLLSNVNPASVEFVKSLVQFVGLEQPSSTIVSSTIVASKPVGTYDSSITSMFLKPLMVPAGHKQVELSLGSGLFLKKAAKAKIIVDAASNPFKLTRLALEALYGEQLKLKGLSAKGLGREKKGVEETDLMNIYNFVTRNANTSNPSLSNKKGEPKWVFTYSVFIKEVNRKLLASARDRKGSSNKMKADVDCNDNLTRDTEAIEPQPDADMWVAGQSSLSGHRCESLQQDIQRSNRPNYLGNQPISHMPYQQYTEESGPPAPFPSICSPVRASTSPVVRSAGTPSKAWDVRDYQSSQHPAVIQEVHKKLPVCARDRKGSSSNKMKADVDCNDNLTRDTEAIEPQPDADIDASMEE